MATPMNNSGKIALLVMLLHTVVVYSRSLECPGYKESIGADNLCRVWLMLSAFSACLAGLCPVGSECINEYCCEILVNDTSTTSTTITDTTKQKQTELSGVVTKKLQKVSSKPRTSTINSWRSLTTETDQLFGSCSNGQPSAGECIDDSCDVGYTCEYGVCCKLEVSSSKVVSTKRRRITTTEMPATATATILPSTLITDSDGDDDNRLNDICPEGLPLGKCVSNRCPEGYTCLNNNCCMTTSDINCNDILKKCDDSMCSHLGYYEFMTRFCPKTCRRCEKIKVVNQCRDKRTDCEQWASEGFCDSPLHSSKQKRYYCAKSCNLCDQ